MDAIVETPAGFLLPAVRATLMERMREKCVRSSATTADVTAGVVLALGYQRLTTVTGSLTLILAFTTCTIPGYLLLLGEWGQIPTWAVLATIAATVAALVPVANRTLRSAPVPAGGEVGGVAATTS